MKLRDYLKDCKEGQSISIGGGKKVENLMIDYHEFDEEGDVLIKHTRVFNDKVSNFNFKKIEAYLDYQVHYVRYVNGTLLIELK